MRAVDMLVKRFNAVQTAFVFYGKLTENDTLQALSLVYGVEDIF